MLFTAHTMGGSGCAYEYALLRYSNNILINLLPSIEVSNISDRALWNVQDLSRMPIFLTADFLWEDGAHYGDRFTIRAYHYDEARSKYVQTITYNTRRKCPSADLSANESAHVLGAEHGHITVLLQKWRMRP